jgi:hypothetical protein
MATVCISEYHPDTIQRSVGAEPIVALRDDSDPPSVITQRVHLSYTIIQTIVAYRIGTDPSLEWMKLRTRVHIYF